MQFHLLTIFIATSDTERVLVSRAQIMLTVTSNRINLFIHSISFRLLPCVWGAVGAGAFYDFPGITVVLDSWTWGILGHPVLCEQQQTSQHHPGRIHLHSEEAVVQSYLKLKEDISLLHLALCINYDFRRTFVLVICSAFLLLNLWK